MKKVILWALAIIVIAVVAASFYLSDIIKEGINTKGPEIAGVPVSVDGVSLSVLGGTAEITGLTVGNPDGFKADHALKLGRVSVSLDIQSLTSDTILIREIIVDQPSIVYEFSANGSNINALQRQISKPKPQAEVASEKYKTNKSNSAKKVVIERVLISNGQVRPEMAGAGVTVPLPTVELTDIGKEKGGTSTADAAKKILSALVSELRGIDPKTFIKGAIGSIQETGDALKEQGKALEDDIKGTVDSLKGLF